MLHVQTGRSSLARWKVGHPVAAKPVTDARAPFRIPMTWLLLFVILTSFLAGGCVRRRLTIRSNPSGAVAFVDDQEVGVTPVSTDFTYYATRKVQLFRDGYETLTVKQPIPAPWYQIPPLDFFFENLWPFEIRDERILDFDLPPQEFVANESVIERAEMLRRSTQAGAVTPLPATATMSP